jgi:hypothetical protein
MSLPVLIIHDRTEVYYSKKELRSFARSLATQSGVEAKREGWVSIRRGSSVFTRALVLGASLSDSPPSPSSPARTHAVIRLLQRPTDQHSSMLLARASATWQPVRSMPGGRLNMCTAGGAGSDTFYVAGGYDFPPPTYESSAIRYNATDNSWSTLPAMGTTRDAFGCGVLGDTLIAVGGESADYPFTLATVELLTLPETNHLGVALKWQPAASMYDARQGHGVAVMGGLVYAAGGMRANGSYIATVEAFNLTANAWLRRPSMLRARAYLGLAACGATLYAVGGVAEGDGNVLADVEAFDEASGRWQALARLPQPRQRFGIVAVPNGRVYVLGGCTLNASTLGGCDILLSSVLYFTPPLVNERSSHLGSWSSAPSLPTANAWLSAASTTFLPHGASSRPGSSIFAVGGGLFYGRNDTLRLDIPSL